MHIGEHVAALEQRGEEAAAVVAIEQDAVLVLPRESEQLRPDLEHSTRLEVENVVELLARELRRPVIEPVGEAVGHLERLSAARELGHVGKAHQRLVQAVVRRPHLLAAGDPVEVFFRDGARPAASVLLLAQGQLVHDGVRLGLDLDVARRVHAHGGGGKPMAEEMAAQLAGLRLPAAVDSLRVEGHRDPSRLQIEVQQQILRLQVHHVLAVALLAAQELFLPQLHAGAPNVVQQNKLLLLCFADFCFPFYTKKEKAQVLFFADCRSIFSPNVSFAGRLRGKDERIWQK